MHTKQTSRTSKILTSNIQAASSLSSFLSTSLGPSAHSKLISTKPPTITNDGSTILSSLKFTHPISSILINLSKSQDSNCGDGTTSVVVLTGYILENLYPLTKDVHPTHISHAIQVAIQKVHATIHSHSLHISTDPHTTTLLFNKKTPFPKDSSTYDASMYDTNTYPNPNTYPNKYFNLDNKILVNSIDTSLSSKITPSYILTPIAINSIIKTNGNLKNIYLIKKRGGTFEDIKIFNSLILTYKILRDNNNDNRINRKVAILTFSLSLPKPYTDSKLSINKSDLMDTLIKEEHAYLKGMCNKVIEKGVNMVIIQKSILKEGISDLCKFYLQRNGCWVVSDVEREDIEKICKCLGTKGVSDIEYLEGNVSEVEVEIGDEYFSIKRSNLKGVSDKDMLEGVNNKGSSYRGVSDKDMIEGVNNEGGNLRGVSDSTNKQQGVKNEDMMEGVSDKDNEQHPVSNICNKQGGVNHIPNEQHLFNSTFDGNTLSLQRNDTFKDDNCSVLLTGGEDVLEECYRNMIDALSVGKCLYDFPFVVFGGGWIEEVIGEVLIKEGNNMGGGVGLCLVEIGKAFKRMVLSIGGSGDIVFMPVRVCMGYVCMGLECAGVIMRIDDILPGRK